MTARERFEQLCADRSLNMHGPDLLDILDDAGLRVIDQPEPAYETTPTGAPVWSGSGFAVLARDDGSVGVSSTDVFAPFDVVLPAHIAAAVSAAHIRAEDYR